MKPNPTMTKNCTCKNLAPSSVHYKDCPAINFFNPTVEEMTEHSKFASYLAQFLSFVEDEANRIDEERRGAYRRDGGRKMQSALYLKQLIEHLDTQIVEDTKRETADSILKKIEQHPYIKDMHVAKWRNEVIQIIIKEFNSLTPKP